MWSKLLQVIITNLIIPLTVLLLNLLVKKWVTEPMEDADRNKKITDGIDKSKEAHNDKERKDALKEVVRGIGSLQP